MTPSQQRAVVAFTVTLAAAAAALGVLTATEPISMTTGVAALALLLPLAVAGSLQVSYQYKGHVDAFDLTEAVLMPVIFLVPGPGAIVIAVAGKLISQLHLKVAGVKLAFNVAQWGFVTALVSLLYRELGTGRGDGRDLLALAAATLVGMVFNHAAVAEVI